MSTDLDTSTNKLIYMLCVKYLRINLQGMTSTNDMVATDINQGRSNAAGTAQQPSIVVAATATTKSKAAKKKEAKLPKLTGKYTFIKPLVESQRVILGKTIDVHSMAMLKHHPEIRKKLKAFARFEGANYANKHDIDPKTGTGRQIIILE